MKSKDLELGELKSLLEQYEALPQPEALAVSAYLEKDYKNDDLAAGLSKLKKVMAFLNAEKAQRESAPAAAAAAEISSDELSAQPNSRLKRGRRKLFRFFIF